MMPNNDDNAVRKSAVKQVLYPGWAQVQAHLHPWINSIHQQALLGDFGAALLLSGKPTNAMSIAEANAARRLWSAVQVSLGDNKALEMAVEACGPTSH